MINRSLIAVGLLACSASAFADTPTGQTFTIQPGQGTPVTMTVVDTTWRKAPYNLTGREEARFTWVRVGQGELVRVQTK